VGRTGNNASSKFVQTHYFDAVFDTLLFLSPVKKFRRVRGKVVERVLEDFDLITG